MSREMKNSGIPWIGEIPENWALEKTKRIFKGNKRIVGDRVDEFERLALTMQGVIRRNKEDNEGLQPEKFDSYQILKKNELVFKLIDLQNEKTSRVGLSPFDGIVSPAYIIISNDSPDNRYYYYWFFDMYNRLVFNRMGDDGVRSSLNMDDVLSIPTPAISLKEQVTIADFLDKKCSEIDSMISLQEKIIEELKAYKQAIILETVTKGLNPDAPMKESGIDWVGIIPVSWDVMAFRRLFAIKKVIAGEEGWDVLSVTQQGLKVKDLSSNEGQMADDYSNYQRVQPGDFVMNHMDLLTGWIDISKFSGVTSPDYRVFQIRDNSVSRGYFLYIFQACYKGKIFYHLGQGVSGQGRWRLPAKQMLLFKLPVPSIEEQNAIVEFLDAKTFEIDSLISLKKAKIESLKEYKKSIIYEYVTGKKIVNA